MANTRQVITMRERKSAERRSDTVDRLTNEIRIAFRRTWNADEDPDLYARELGIMCDEFGVERTERAVQLAIWKKTFKPSIAELRELVPLVPQQCWRPTPEDIKAREDARNSPERQAFLAKVREISSAKTFDRSPGSKRDYIPTRAELAAEMASNPYLRLKPATAKRSGQ